MYDIIGDIHGHADKLEELLNTLGYAISDGVYKHPKNRQVVFLGDYIDRGPKIRETLHMVKSMCDAGHAIAIMGNHEFNAICFHTKDVENGGFYRKHGITEIEQHLETLRQFKYHKDEWNNVFLPWFHTLPVFLEFDSFRVVHACWDDQHVDWLKSNSIYSPDGKTISVATLAKYASKQSTEYTVLEELLKGKEFDLPDGQEFTDKDGAIRSSARIKWFNPIQNRNFHRDVFLGIGEEFGNLPVAEELKVELHSYDSDISVFFGHYWLKGKPDDPHSKSICLDYSVAKDGHLVGYKVDEKEFVVV
ncbi:MAG: metallophosphoesterase [Aquirufa sp.]|jgi:hypothetical protein